MSDPRPAARTDDGQGRQATARAAASAPTPAEAPPRYGERPVESTRDRVAREKAEFGGMRFFLAFFGWLAATGAVVLLTAVATAILAAIGLQASSADAQSADTQRTAAIVGISVLAFALFVGYYIGGYVAGRMARFSGLKQGLAVWLWAVIVAVVVAIAAAVVGGSTDAFSQLGTAGLPISGATATATGVSSVVVAVVFSLLGALIGGLAGMRFHRRVDRFAQQG